MRSAILAAVSLIGLSAAPARADWYGGHWHRGYHPYRGYYHGYGYGYPRGYGYGYRGPVITFGFGVPPYYAPPPLAYYPYAYAYSYPRYPYPY